MRVGYHLVWPVLLLVIGALETAAGVALLTEVQIVLGFAFLGFGALLLFRPYFEFDPHTRSIAVKALIGSKTRQYGGANGGWLDIVGDRIVWIRPDGTRQNVPVRRAQANREEWNAVLAQIATSR